MDIKDLKNADLTEMVFEKRNRDYGAYQLRRKYSKHMTIALTLACAAFLLLIGFPVLAKMLNLFPEEEKTAMVVTQVELVDPPPLDETKPEPPKVEPPPPVKETIQFVAPEIKKDEDVVEQEEDPIKIIDSLKETNAQVANVR
jgi:protein TonB